jgi:hypothetical protein
VRLDREGTAGLWRAITADRTDAWVAENPDAALGRTVR